VFDVVRGVDGWAGITGRALRNRFTDAWHGREAVLRERMDAEGKAYYAAVERQDFDTALIFAGEAVDLIDAVLPAAEIVRRIVH
jgi:nitronate monooxygenase